MFTKGKNLERDFPEIAVFVDSIARRATSDVVGIYLVRKPSTPGGNFFRTKGQFTEEQISRIARAHTLSKTGVLGLTKTQKGLWTEYSAPIGLNHLNVENIVFSDSGQSLSSFLEKLTGEDDLALARVFVNGKEADSAPWDRLGSGDVVVALSDGEEHGQGSLHAFEDMARLEVFQEKLLGPYTDERIVGYLPGQIWLDDQISRALKIRPSDVVICPRCGEGDCTDHRLLRGEKIFVRRGYSQFLYAFQTAALIGRSATEVLTPFALTVLGRKIDNNIWPPEVLKLTIGDDDATHSTCNSQIEAGDTVSVYLADPRL
ncbi:MAG: hypothetical protein HYV90_00065 [Candidatus Woesebacteria bacterium]|nr:MAG: hypothetical protein HYV90_00065 [Candidatus Woesebacteria bacterium]